MGSGLAWDLAVQSQLDVTGAMSDPLPIHGNDPWQSHTLDQIMALASAS